MLAGLDPTALFADYQAGALSLSVSSAARDFGSRADAPPFDILRKRRGTMTGLYDAGAYEFAFIQNAVDPSWVYYR